MSNVRRAWDCYRSFTFSMLTTASNNIDSINCSSWVKKKKTILTKQEKVGRRETEGATREDCLI